VTDTPEVDPGLINTFGRLVEAYHALERRADRSLVQALGLPLTWLEVLLRVSRAEDGLVSMSALAGQLALTTSGVTRLLDRMTEAGYVQRVPCPTDRRVAYAALTPAGTAKLGEAMIVHAANLQEAFASFTDTDLVQLDRLLDRLRAQN